MTSQAPLNRCPWCLSSELYQAYHDEEWGVPEYDGLKLLEWLNLEGAQAGLSWITILKKREGYRRAFEGFDPVKVAAYSPEKVEALMQDSGIVRNRLKINAVINNARVFLEEGSPEQFRDSLWKHVGGKPIQNQWHEFHSIPSSTPESDAMSRDLKKRGYKFVGSTICYAFMQACGMVNDHLSDCHRYEAIRKLG